ncbi:histidine kinase [Janthinobacterium sp. 17J80-10]|uniref:sensor histidine kinase n=1 Tax=Janthinobacterium sp. 17J80-10 TaxID=2497863 RepID=UPI0010058BB7|nr:histidine kinase [Janthinobacterium sp. 17J80-10]QAU33448.1 histidine kinase [Janthinobacterium sp. 17J80-10]
MVNDKLGTHGESAFGLAYADVEARMVCGIRVMLAVSALLMIWIVPGELAGISDYALLPVGSYAIYSVALGLFVILPKHFIATKRIHWIDLGWYASIVFFTGGVNSIFFLFLFFPILTASFQWGFEEGARIAMASTVLFLAFGLLTPAGAELPRLMLRATFLLAFGYLCAKWGESKVASARRLGLLRDVSRLSNPRFGVDHTITNVLTRVRDFFHGSNCILVTRGSDAAVYELRRVGDGEARTSPLAEKIVAEAAAPLMEFSQVKIIMFSRPSRAAVSLFGCSYAYDISKDAWEAHDRLSGEKMANLLETESYVSVPIFLKNGEGRIYVTSSHHAFSKADALFLNHVVAQAFPVIESIELLDRIASHAALRERQRIAWDFHDTAIQPYVGLKMGLSALRNKATLDNPLIHDLDKLLVMAGQVIGELRDYAGMVKSGAGVTEPVYLLSLRRQVAQTKEFYGVDITVSARNDVDISDRLAAEVLQIAREGINNICKHTTARHGAIAIQSANGWLAIRIENENAGPLPANFMPRSIMERTAALGGNVIVKQGVASGTCVQVEIPI